MKLYTGIDLHSNNHYITIIDEQDNRLFEKRVSNDLEKTLTLLSPYKSEMISIAIESTYNWYWLADGLIEHGYDVKLVNTVAVQQYSGLKYTDDQSDAFWLAHLMRLGILPTGHIYPKAQRGVRDLLRKRLQLVQDRVSHMLRIQSQVTRSTALHISITDIKKLNFDPASVPIDKNVDRAIRADLACVAILNKQIESVEECVLAQCRLKQPFKLLTTVPGIGKMLAMTIMLETGDLSRFNKVGNYASYCRCVASNRYSNGKKKGVNNTKNGNKHLARAFVEAAYYAARFHEKPKAYFAKKERQVNRTLATKALAHKLARACYYIMRDQVIFDEKKLFS
ncbi:IS110 family transposase [Dasania marina]|uniref:IS110 family transposase n=1 Tax=Dasania marina TaxID=471499 RepID=UPI0030D6D701|tara:strand:+ start:43837 stop:44850 length:1014 start_codon:yes stop_codon:yes gene_type:complete